MITSSSFALLMLLIFLFSRVIRLHGDIIDVKNFGAKGDGVTEDSQAFQLAWREACLKPNSVLLIPQAHYLVRATKFEGPCFGKQLIQIDGTVVAPGEPEKWDPMFDRHWLLFSYLHNVYFNGSGVFDGSGAKWWEESCKKKSTKPCNAAAPTAITIHACFRIKIKGLTFNNSQQIHLAIEDSKHVNISNIVISAPEDSPNTDGIHISNSTDVFVLSSNVGTGDDCISIVNSSYNIRMLDIHCGPGHGISIGSLGKNNSRAVVTHVYLEGSSIRNTTNGVRIKTWQGGLGYVRDVHFKDVVMEEVQNPVIINQFYCDSPTTCLNQTDAVAISDIYYHNISGSSSTSEALRFACSDTFPCRNIHLSSINLYMPNGTAVTYCHSATGFLTGTVNPPAGCLRNKERVPHTMSLS